MTGAPLTPGRAGAAAPSGLILCHVVMCRYHPATLTAPACTAKVWPPNSALIFPHAMSATKTAPESTKKRTVPKMWGQMPSRMKVLYVTTLHRTGGWLAEAFRADCAAEVLLVESI